MCYCHMINVDSFNTKHVNFNLLCIISHYYILSILRAIVIKLMKTQVPLPKSKRLSNNQYNKYIFTKCLYILRHMINMNPVNMLTY